MKGKAYLSTGEAAKVLGISRSTVSRRFDEGTLVGKAHPITGERLISVESVERFLEEHVHPVEASPLVARQVVLRSERSDLIEAMEAILAGDRRIKLDRAARGSDALIACARKVTDLLILDDAPTDIACADIIRALRNLDEWHKMAVLCCLRHSTPQQASLWGADEILPVSELGTDEPKARLYELLHLPRAGAGDQAAPVEHRRQWPRHALNVPGTIGVYRLRAPEEQAWGSVMVDNISVGGAGLSQMKLDSNSLPAESFRMLLRIDAPLLPDWQAHCQVVRLKVNGEVTAGVQFVQMPPKCRETIESFGQTRQVAPVMAS